MCTNVISVRGFELEVKTDNLAPGSSGPNQFQLPLIATGTYNMQVLWGDNTVSNITAWDQAEKLHTYAGGAGTYKITIHNTCTGWAVNNYGDRFKLIDIKHWGPNFLLGPGSDGQFFGTNNMTVSATDSLNLGTNPIIMEYGFAASDNLTFNNVLTSLNITNTSSLTQANFMFYHCTAFNQDLSTSWDFSNILITTSMFEGCTSFKQSLANWDLKNCFDMTDMFKGCDLNTVTVPPNQDNYNATLLAWGNKTNLNPDVGQRFQPNVIFNAGNSQYTAANAAVVQARQNLINYGWLITDGGAV